MKSVQELLKMKSPSVFKSGLSISPEITEKKLNNAVAKFRYEEDPYTIVLLFDTTLFGSGKEGLLFSGTKMVHKASFEDPVDIGFETILKAEYFEEVTTDKKGNERVRKNIRILFRDDSDSFVLKDLHGCHHELLADFITEIGDSASDGDLSESSQIVEIKEMTSVLKMSYVKIIVNMTLSDDGVVDQNEYAEILSLMVRLEFSFEERGVLYTYISEGEEGLVSTSDLMEIVIDQCPAGNENSIRVSLVKDLLNIHKKTSDGEDGKFLFLDENKPVFGVTDEEIDFAKDSINKDMAIYDKDSDDKTLKKNAKELLAKAGALGLPMAALYMSGSVVGMSAAGITSGLAALGFGGALGFSSMATGLGVFLLVGLGAYKGVKYLTGANEVEGKLIREKMLQEVLKTTQKTINALIEDSRAILDEFCRLTKEATIDRVMTEKLKKQLVLLNRAGVVLSEKSQKCEILALQTKCPKVLDVHKLKKLTSDATKAKFYEMVLSCYEEKEVEKNDLIKKQFLLKEDLPLNKIEPLVKVFSIVGYFDAAANAKSFAKNLGKKMRGNEGE